MRKCPVLLLLVLIGSILACGCARETPQPVPDVTTAETPKTVFSTGEPWSDGNIRITILQTRETTGGKGERTITVSLYLENLVTSPPTSFSAGEFQLLEPDGSVISPAEQQDPQPVAFTLTPGQRKQVDLNYIAGTGLSGSRIRYDFSRSSGVNGSVVYFSI
jgi:hypothetical protein